MATPADSRQEVIRQETAFAHKLVEQEEAGRAISSQSQSHRPASASSPFSPLGTNGPPSFDWRGLAGGSNNGNSGVATHVPPTSHAPSSPPNSSPLHLSGLINSSAVQKPIDQTHLKMAEDLAQRLMNINRQKEVEKQQKEVETKRKRDHEEEWPRIVRRKVEEQRNLLEEEEKQQNGSNKEVYALFNDLQGISKDLNLPFDYPEIVIVGMQSDGKSSFVEGLLGFQFNIVESNIGTRRPLIIQMINDASRDQPSCQFRKENYHATGHSHSVDSSSSDSLGDSFEDRDTPVHELTEEIVRRTNERAGHGQDKVSPVPIILRVRYAHCANLTIYDTPGFRLGGDEKLRNDIKNMVIHLIEPKHRIIVCLEQSTVEWANTVSRPIVRQIDPEFSRTVLVNTKFDNRVKELRTKESADKYLAGENLPSHVRPFFISMPLKRNMDSKRFKDAIKDAFLDDYNRLLESEFDETKFLPQVGMFRIKSYLEKLLNEKYQQSLVPTLRALEDLCKKTEYELDQVKTELNRHDLESLKNKSASYVQAFVTAVDHLLAGSIAGSPDMNGESLIEEKMNSGVSDWPEFSIDFDVLNSKLKVYGGAQYSRLLNEFEYVAHSREFPTTTANEIASSLGASRLNTALHSPETAAANLVQMKAKQVFLPLIDILLQRSSYIMKRLFPIAVQVIREDKEQSAIGILSVYEGFMKELRITFESFIDRTESDCRSRLKDDFVMFTKILDWDMLTMQNQPGDSVDPSQDNNGSHYNFLSPSPSDTKKRVEDLMERSTRRRSSPSNRDSHENPQRNGESSSEGYERVALVGAKMFASIRFFFVKYVMNKMNAFFLDPMLRSIGASVVNHFYRIPGSKFEEMFSEGVVDLREMAGRLENQLLLCRQQRDRFKDMYHSIRHQHHNK